MKKLFFVLGFVLVVGSGSALAQAAPDIVIVRLYDSGELLITRGEGKSEVVPAASGIGKKYAIGSSEAYYRVVKQLYAEGYVLQGALPTVTSNNMVLFVRAPKP